MGRAAIAVFGALVEAFANELPPYERSKGTLKFPLSEPVPVRLIERIARFLARQVTARQNVLHVNNVLILYSEDLSDGQLYGGVQVKNPFTASE